MDASPGRTARTAGVFYLLTIVFGALALFLSRGALAANLTATACYVAVTVLFYGLFKPVSKRVSGLAAFVGLMGCAVGALTSFQLVPSFLNGLIFFGFYCLLIGYLIFKSAFLPWILGVLMAIGGLGWLTFIWPPLARSLSPYNMAPGILGETVLALWLVAVGVNVPRWKEKAQAAQVRATPRTA
jgi:hypothetical protein